MSKHTPGPWIVGPVDDTLVSHIAADGKRYEIAAIDGDYNHPDTWPIMEANARLIAAAPALLEALEACYPWLRTSPEGEAATRIALAAIAKATGENE